MQLKFALPLPRFVLHPRTAVVIAIVHVYLASGHLFKLVAGEVAWAHIWKGFGALLGAYVFAALASRRAAKPLQRTVVKESDVDNSDRVSVTGRFNIDIFRPRP
jgi:uncharacterized membrane protein YfcA